MPIKMYRSVSLVKTFCRVLLLKSFISSYALQTSSIPLKSLSLPTIRRINSSMYGYPSRNAFIENFMVPSILISTASKLIPPKNAYASNLPKSNGADFSKSNTVEALIPIVQIKESLSASKTILFDGKEETFSSSQYPEYTSDQMKIIADKMIAILSSKIPFKNESAFKKLFDEYSDPVSYKQKFMDQNAFLVYYTKGFDGPNRPTMESGEVPKQTLQYGFRNDAWVAWKDLTDELAFAKDNGGVGTNVADLSVPLDRALLALDQYLKLVPDSDIEKAITASKKSF